MRIATLVPPASTNCGMVADNDSLPLCAFHGADQTELELPLLSLYEYNSVKPLATSADLAFLAAV